MPLPHDTAPKLADYADPDRPVTTAWLAEHVDDPDLVVVESDEDVLFRIKRQVRSQTAG